MNPFTRPCTTLVEKSLARHGLSQIQIMVGPRQVGKSWAADQIAKKWKGPVHFAASDELAPPSPEWIAAQWEAGRRLAGGADQALLILDEVQKIPHWTEAVKGQWDRDARSGRRLRVLLLGSSALLMQKGMSESLAGRFLLHRFPHWSWPEMREAFGYGLEDWLRFGGYPGAARFRQEPAAWAAYLRDSIIEAVLNRDILQLQTVRKPALLRHLFALACSHPAQILSYNKMLGQLAEAGNASTLAHYLKLLESAFIAGGLEPWQGGGLASRAGSPKLILWDNALIHAAVRTPPLDEASWRGRLAENAVGAQLLRHLGPAGLQLHYWRRGNDEVDFVVSSGPKLWALEVKSGRPAPARGMAAFLKAHPRAVPMTIGPGGVALDAFFNSNPADLFR